MAVRFDASTDALSRTTALPTAPTTFMGWFRVAVDGNQIHNFIAAGASTGSIYVQIGADFTGGSTNLFIWDGVNSVNGSNISLTTWYHITLIIQDPDMALNDSFCYLNGVLDITNPDTNAATYPYAKIWIGNDNDSEFLNGRAAAIKIWNAELTAAEILNEMRQYLPIRTTNLYGFWPLFNTAVDQNDYSGNANTWTVGGTLADEDGPPIPWAINSKRLILPSATVVPPVIRNRYKVFNTKIIRGAA